MQEVSTPATTGGATGSAQERTRRWIWVLAGLLAAAGALLVLGVAQPSPVAYVAGAVLVLASAWPVARLAGPRRALAVVATAFALTAAVALVAVPLVLARPTSSGVLWERTLALGEAPSEVAVVDDALVLVDGDAATVVDAATGEVRASVPMGGDPLDDRQVADAGGGYVLVRSGSTTGVYSVADGSPAWTVPTGRDVAVAAADGTVVLASLDTGAITVRDLTGGEPWTTADTALLPRDVGDRRGTWSSSGLPSVVVTASDDDARRRTLDVRTGDVVDDRPTRDGRVEAIAADLVLWQSRDTLTCDWTGVRAGATVWTAEHGCSLGTRWTGATRILVEARGEGRLLLDLATGDATPLPSTVPAEIPNLALTVSDDVVLAPATTGGDELVATDPPATTELWRHRAHVELDGATWPGEPMARGAVALLTVPGAGNPFVSSEVRAERYDVAVLDARTGEQTGSLTGGRATDAWGTAPGRALVLTRSADGSGALVLVGPD